MHYGQAMAGGKRLNITVMKRLVEALPQRQHTTVENGVGNREQENERRTGTQPQQSRQCLPLHCLALLQGPDLNIVFPQPIS